MTDTSPQVVRNYLAQLESALAGLPREVSGEIVAGVREELTGLDAATAAIRIEELGDPAFIAAEARAETPESSAPATAGEPLWYVVIASILVAVGGIIVPVLGWIVGIAMVWFSRTWRLWEKLVATLLPFATIAVAMLASVIGRLVTAPPPVASSGGFHGPSTEDLVNPLLPSPFDILHSSLVLVVGLNVVTGIWLLWRARRGRQA